MRVSKATVLMAWAVLWLPAWAADTDFKPLVEGGNLKAWQRSPGPWVVENGILVLKDRTDEQMRNENYLWTKKRYGNFVLDLEFKVQPRSNSGVFLRTSDLQDPVQTGIEIQVAGHTAGQPLDRGSVGGIYDLAAPRKNTLRPDDWNHYVITCQGSRITVEMNGELVSEADLEQWKEAHKNPDGSENKFKRPLKDFARAGYIGLQDHGSWVAYRNIRIRELRK